MQCKVLSCSNCGHKLSICSKLLDPQTELNIFKEVQDFHKLKVINKEVKLNLLM